MTAKMRIQTHPIQCSSRERTPVERCTNAECSGSANSAQRLTRALSRRDTAVGRGNGALPDETYRKGCTAQTRRGWTATRLPVATNDAQLRNGMKMVHGYVCWICCHGASAACC